ncbi:MAG: hypothetical protein ACRDOX_01460 [Nocardioides sp.]
MSRRVSLPAADDLFRRTAQGGDKSHVRAVGPDEDAVDQETQSGAEPGTARKPSGRVRHDEKMTVYVTSDELLDLEHARLTLRRAQGLAVDRGRLVREAVALVLADYEANGDDSVLVRRLTEE